MTTPSITSANSALNLAAACAIHGKPVQIKLPGPLNIEDIAAEIEQLIALTESKDCKAIQEKSTRVMNKVKSKIDGLTKQIASTSPFAALAHPPLNPMDAVKWIKNFIASNITPQVQANIKLVLALALLMEKLPGLIQAIDKIGPTLEACAINTLNNDISTLACYAGQDMNKALNGALSNIASGVSLIEKSTNQPSGIVAPALSSILNTSNLSNFVASATATSANGATGLDTFNSTLSTLQPNEITAYFVGTLTSGNNKIADINANNAANVAIGNMIADDIGSIPSNTTVVSINTYTGSVPATMSGHGATIFTMSPIDSNVVIGTQLYSTDPTFANGSTVTNLSGSSIALSSTYLGTNTSITLTYNIDTITMSSNATITGTANLTFTTTSS